jgi:hypothetical protein
LGIFERENDDKPYWDDKPWGVGAFGFWILNKHFEPRDFENVLIPMFWASNCRNMSRLGVSVCSMYPLVI